MIRAEVEKTRRAGDISAGCGLFRTPQVLDYDEARGEVVFERIAGLQPVRLILTDVTRSRQLLENLGRALAAIHRELRLPAELKIPLPRAYCGDGEQVFFHGDVSIDNVNVLDGSPLPVILDWQTTPLLGGRATYGTCYFDLAWLLHNLFNRPTFRMCFKDRITTLARGFVAAYAAQTGEPFQGDSFFAYLEKFFNLELPRVPSYTSRRERIFLPRSQYLLRKYLHSGRPC
jgi:hypothetical protein